jgi:soluble lytic murein transglycosylase
MKDGSQPPAPREVSPRREESDTFEYQTGRPRVRRATGASREGRGYWVAPEADGRTPESGGRSRARGRGRLWLAALVIVLVCLGTAAALVLTGRTAVPVLSSKIFPIHYQEEIVQVADKYGQDAYLIAAVVKAESGYDPGAGSSAGAVGLMQLLPETAEWIAAELESWEGHDAPVLTDPADSLELGTCYLAYLSRMYGDGDRGRQLTLAAYNAGPGNVNEWIEAVGGREKFSLADIQFPETRAYVERVEHYRLLYERIHPGVFVK